MNAAAVNKREVPGISLLTIFAALGGLAVLGSLPLALFDEDESHRRAIQWSIEHASALLEAGDADSVRATAQAALAERLREPAAYLGVSNDPLDRSGPLGDIVRRFGYEPASGEQLQGLRVDAVRDLLSIASRAANERKLWNVRELAGFVAANPALFTAGSVQKAQRVHLVITAVPVAALLAIALALLTQFRPLNSLFLALLFAAALACASLAVLVQSAASQAGMPGEPWSEIAVFVPAERPIAGSFLYVLGASTLVLCALAALFVRRWWLTLLLYVVVVGGLAAWWFYGQPSLPSERADPSGEGPSRQQDESHDIRGDGS